MNMRLTPFEVAEHPRRRRRHWLGIIVIGAISWACIIGLGFAITGATRL